jgi:hypothetical protein
VSDKEVICIIVAERDDGRFDGNLANSEHDAAIYLSAQDRPEQVVFSAYSYLVHKRNGDLHD